MRSVHALDVEHFACVVVAKAVGTEVIINMLLVSRGTRVHLINVLCAEDGALYGEACFVACSIGSCSGRSAGLDFEHFHNLVKAFQCCFYLWQTNVWRAMENAFVYLLRRCTCSESAFDVGRNILRCVVGSENNERQQLLFGGTELNLLIDIVIDKLFADSGKLRFVFNISRIVLVNKL